MGITNRLARKEQQTPSQDEPKSQGPLQGQADQGVAVDATSDGVSPDIMEKEKVTLLACLLGACASLGGFMFGYVR